MDKEFHLYFNDGYPYGEWPAVLHTFTQVKEAIDRGDKLIRTTQVMQCTTKLFEKGYKIFIHPVVGDTFEIKLGDNEPYTNRLINPGHNLYRLLIAGEFDIPDKVVTW